MPTNRRRRRPGRRTDVQVLTPDLLRELLHGQGMFGNVEDDAVVDAWEQHGDAILERWIAEWPGTRPFAWWLCDAPGERLVVPAFDQSHRAGWAKHGVMHTHTIPPIQESEEEFLSRHDLLTPDEAAALDRGEGRPIFAADYPGPMDVFKDLLADGCEV
jgi:hypothetical protein